MATLTRFSSFRLHKNVVKESYVIINLILTLNVFCLAQAMAGNQGVLGPTKIYLAVQPPPGTVPASPAATAASPVAPAAPSESPKAKVQLYPAQPLSPPLITSLYRRMQEACRQPPKCRLFLDYNDFD